MKKKLHLSKVVFVSALLIFMVVSCSVNQGTNDEPQVLSNGEVASESEMQALKRLQPEAEKLIASIVGEKTATSMMAGGEEVAVEMETLELVKKEITALLKREFGDDYKKFITDEEYKLEGATRADKREYLGENNIYRYFMEVHCRKFEAVFVAWNYAGSKHYAYNKLTGATENHYVKRLRTGIIDEVGTRISPYVYNKNSSGTKGNTKGGFFARMNSKCTTKHDIFDTNVSNRTITLTWYR